jgi:hypothetical protein
LDIAAHYYCSSENDFMVNFLDFESNHIRCAGWLSYEDLIFDIAKFYDKNVGQSEILKYNNPMPILGIGFND